MSSTQLEKGLGNSWDCGKEKFSLLLHSFMSEDNPFSADAAASWANSPEMLVGDFLCAYIKLQEGFSHQVSAGGN